jgi:hypothetical protein
MPSTWCALPLCAQVSAFIVLAKEQAGQEQAIKGQQRMLGCTTDSCLLKAAHQFLPGSHLLHGGLLQQQQQQQLHCSSAAMPQTVYPQAQLPVMVDSLAWQQQQQQFYGAGSSSGMQSMTPQQQQQLWVAPPGLSQQMVLVSSPAAAAAAAYNTLGSSMSSASSASTLSAATAAVQSNMSSPAAAGAAYMLCTAPDGQQVLVPISAGDAGSAMPAVYSAADAATLMQQQVQAQQLLAAQELSNNMAAQQQQHNMLLLNGAATSQPVQLSVQPQLTTIAGHMAAAHMTTEQHQLQQLQQQLAMSMPMVFGPAGTDCNSMPPASAVAANSAAAALVNMSAASAGHVLTQQTAGAVTNTVSNASATAMLAGNAAAAGSTACATTSFVGDMLRGLDCYTSATVAAGAAAAADRIASPLNPQQQQQLQHVLLAGSRAAGDSLADSNSSSCSPMLGVSGMMFEASNLTAHLGNNSRVGQLRSQSGVTSSHNMSCGGARMAASPTCSSSSSNGSSSSQGFPANERVMYQVS